MKPPRRVKIGPVEFSVYCSTGAWQRAMRDRDPDVFICGTTYSLDAKIYLNPSIAPGPLRSVLLHEVMHAVTFTLCGDPDYRTKYKPLKSAFDANEQFVRDLEAPLLGVLRDNPRLVAYLTSKE